MEDLSPELSELKDEIEENANVTEEVKDAVPTTEADSATSAADVAGVAAGAMTKAKQAMAKIDEREDGLTDEVEIDLDEMHQPPSGDATPPEPAGESIDFGAIAPPEPEFSAEPEISTYSAEDIMAAQQNYELSNRVAQMVPAEYEEWMFPPMGHPDIISVNSACPVLSLTSLPRVSTTSLSTRIPWSIHARFRSLPALGRRPITRERISRQLDVTLLLPLLPRSWL